MWELIVYAVIRNIRVRGFSAKNFVVLFLLHLILNEKALCYVIGVIAAAKELLRTYRGSRNTEYIRVAYALFHVGGGFLWLQKVVSALTCSTKICLIE